ncbi:MAG: hypothetical protein HRU09_10800 [Oligoflexales bacterium]|nr:hypothetical protein [Oligoflexales bacterium]
MAIEFEYQYLDFCEQSIKEILQDNGGKRLYKPTLIRAANRYFLDSDGKPTGFVRVRHELKGLVLTHKKFSSGFSQETELHLGKGVSFEKSLEFIKDIDFGHNTRIETVEKYREEWCLPIEGINEIVFDKWPGLPTILEIDCKDKPTLEKLQKLLNLEQKKSYTAGCFYIYEDLYGIPSSILFQSSLEFESVKSELGRYASRNKDIFEENAARPSDV